MASMNAWSCEESTRPFKAAGDVCISTTDCREGLTCDFGQEPSVCASMQSGKRLDASVPDANSSEVDARRVDPDAGPQPDARDGMPDATPMIDAAAMPDAMGTPDASPTPDASVLPDVAPVFDAS